jgi:hypothetical protein
MLAGSAPAASKPVATAAKYIAEKKKKPGAPEKTPVRVMSPSSKNSMKRADDVPKTSQAVEKVVLRVVGSKNRSQTLRNRAQNTTKPRF